MECWYVSYLIDGVDHFCTKDANFDRTKRKLIIRGSGTFYRGVWFGLLAKV